MVRFAALAVVLSLSGLPLTGTVLCGVACAPAVAQPAGCHDHGTEYGAAAALRGAHTCDHDAGTAPVVLQTTSAGTSAPVAGPTPIASAVLAAAVLPHRAWELPPGAHASVLPQRTSVLRI